MWKISFWSNVINCIKSWINYIHSTVKFKFSNILAKQKDFFDISADETISEGQIEATYGLTQMQRQVLTEAYNELKQIEEDLNII